MKTQAEAESFFDIDLDKKALTLDELIHIKAEFQVKHPKSKLFQAIITNPLTRAAVLDLCGDNVASTPGPYGSYLGADIISLSVLPENTSLCFNDREKAYEFAGYAEGMANMGADINETIGVWNAKESYDIHQITDGIYLMEKKDV